MKTKAEKARLKIIYDYMFKHKPENADYADCVFAADQLIRINHKLTKLGITDCSVELSEEEQKKLEEKEEKYLKKCEKLAKNYNSEFYYQSDPRGIMVYLVPNEEIQKEKNKIDEEYDGNVKKWLKSYYYSRGIGFEYK